MLRADHLTLYYGRRPAVRDVSFAVNEGEVVALLGANGAGKTSTLHMLVGILSPTEGMVSVAGEPLTTDNMEGRRRIGFVPDRPILYPSLTGREYIRFVAGLYGLRAAEADAAAAPWLERFGLASRADDLTSSYSHGMRQKLLITTALTHGPSVLVLDEPMVGLDPNAARLLRETIRSEADAGRAILLSTHVLSVAEQLADRVIVMVDGQVHAEGPPAELAEQLGATDLEDVFFQIAGGANA
jgi:ABC-2 type transport system ATP-binding protein